MNIVVVYNTFISLQLRNVHIIEPLALASNILYQSFLFIVPNHKLSTPPASLIFRTLKSLLKILASLCGFQHFKSLKAMLSVAMKFSSQIWSMGEGEGMGEYKKFSLRVQQSPTFILLNQGFIIVHTQVINQWLDDSTQI